MRASRISAAVLAVWVTGLAGAGAQPERPDDEAPALSPHEELTQELFEPSDDPESFAAKVAKARKNGLPEQAILEARFLFLVDRQDFPEVAKLVPALEKQKENFRIEDSVIFSVPEEFLAITEYARALGALEQNDHAGFKKHITEAFWLSPRQASAFAPHIERLRLDLAMAGVTVDFQQPFPKQSDGEPVSLATAAGEAKHVLIHFWSPWSAECEAFLPDFIATARELHRHHIAVVSLLVEPGDEALELAREFRSGIEEEQLGEWIVDNPKASLARTLRVQDLPTVTLLATGGKVLFNGHPADDALWTALRKVDPEIERPRLETPESPPADDLPE